MENPGAPWLPPSHLELITELLFADDCALLAYSEEALQHIINRFSDEDKDFGLTISLKKTEALYQPPPQKAFSRPQISIDGTNLNAVEHVTYLGSLVSDDATFSKDLGNRLTKASSSFGRLSERVWQSHLLRLSTKIRIYRAVVVPIFLQKPGFTIGSRSGYLRSFTNAACTPSLASIKWQNCV